MTGWIILAVYLAGLVVTARKAALAFAADDDNPDVTGLILDRMLGFLIGMGWPVVVLGALVTGKLPKTDAQLRAENDRMKAHIADLERELGLTDSRDQS